MQKTGLHRHHDTLKTMHRLYLEHNKSMQTDLEQVNKEKNPFDAVAAWCEWRTAWIFATATDTWCE